MIYYCFQIKMKNTTWSCKSGYLICTNFFDCADVDLCLFDWVSLSLFDKLKKKKKIRNTETHYILYIRANIIVYILIWSIKNTSH